jgi:predicted dienelactone hydrolase
MLPTREYAARGPHPVGLRTVAIPDTKNQGREIPTYIWYPADRAAWDRSPEAAHPIGATHAARTNAAPAALPGPCPLVAFSHGNSGFACQSTFLTTHLASWGMVVTAPDHTGNTFFEMLGIDDEDERIRIHKQACSNRPRDLGTSIETVLAGGPWPEASADRIGVAGHSFGGWTALKMPRRDPRVQAVCGLAPASESFIGRKAFEPGELPFVENVSSLVVSALDDVLVDIDTSLWPLFDRLANPRALVGVHDTDHFHFCDHLELLHGLHEKNGRRRKQTRATRRYAELLPEARTHALLATLVTAFFAATLAEDLGLPDLSPETLARIDPKLDRLDVDRDSKAAAQ